jgi:hypothetical protein
MQLNDLFAAELDANGIAYQREYKPIPGRRLSYDFFIGSLKRSLPLLVELQGGTWMVRSGHNTGKGIQRDCEKLNLATLNEYAVMQFTTQMVEDGTAIEMVQEYLGG